MSKNNSGFLKILTILSFVGIAIYIAMGALMVVSGSAAKMVYEVEELEIQVNTQIAQLEQQGGIANRFTADYLKAGRHIRSLGFVTIFWQIFCLLGVLKMRKHNKVGFALYSIGEFAVPLSMAVFINIFTALVPLIIATVFVFLYSMHLNQMSFNKATA